MMITMLIVLVLLFVLYRMMPGSAAATLMMQPGMTQEQIDMVMVRYGFGRWTEYPGDYSLASSFQANQIGHYEATVYAVDSSGSDSFSTEFDVNAPLNKDMLPPEILEIGFESASPPGVGSPAQIYAIVQDDYPLRSVDIDLTYPNYTFENPQVLFSRPLTLTMDDVRSDEANMTFYYNVTTPDNLVAGDYTISLEATDFAKNTGSAILSFDAASQTITTKIWNITLPSIFFVNGNYNYPIIGNTLALNASVESTNTPTYSVVSASGEIITTLTQNGTYVIPAGDNGMMTLLVEADGFSAYTSFPVNSAATLPAAVQDDDTGYPLLSDLVITNLEGDGSYPFISGSTEILINATVLADTGEIHDNITATIVFPDGTIIGEWPDVSFLKHPHLVVMVSMPEQFVTYMKTMLVFDFGTSFTYNRPVWDLIVDRIPSTALLFGSSMILAYIIGILIGVLVAWKRGTVMEMGTIVTTLFFYSMPIFWFALIMQWVFYAELNWFPLAGVGGRMPDGTQLHGIAYLLDVLWHLTLPLITLTILSLAGTILLMRGAMLEVIGEDFITTAKAKGLKERTVVYHHAARNALLPVVTSMAMSIGHIISGGVLTETIFSWYGMGTLLIEGTLQHDFPVVQGAFYIMALLTVLGNMGADILYAYLDPRVQL